MIRSTGTRFIPTPTLLKNRNELFGCFLDKSNFAVHWYHEKLRNKKRGVSYQTNAVMPRYKVEYPILCYEGPYPDCYELQVINLADMSASRSYLKL